MSDNTLSSQRGTNPPNRDVNAAQRASLAVQLRATKMTYQQIAVQCGYSNASAARKAVQRELDRCVIRNVDILRNEEADSLDRLERKCWQRLDDAKHDKAMLFAVDRIVQIKERRAKLLGLDTAVKDANVAANMVVIREVPQGYLGVQEGKA